MAMLCYFLKLLALVVCDIKKKYFVTEAAARAADVDDSIKRKRIHVSLNIHQTVRNERSS